DSRPHGAAGTDYGPVSLTAEGGTERYGVAITAGTLPDGMVLADGSLSGTPTDAGRFTFTVTATSTHDFTGSREYTLAIDSLDTPIGPDALPSGSAGAVYGPMTFTADGGSEPYSFALSGDLPEGLAFEDGVVSGTPTQAGPFLFIVTV